MTFDLRAIQKITLIFSALVAGALLAGCAAPRQAAALEPVGPMPTQGAVTAPGKGCLVVFSAYDVISTLDYTGNYIAHYSSYRIFGTEGHLLKTVANQSGSFVEHPQSVELPVGKYTVVAEAEGCGRVKVPVVIEAGRVTVVELNGDKFWSQLLGFNATNSVPLPTGELAGWQAASANTATH